MGNKYPYSVFYFPRSVFDDVGKNLTKGTHGTSSTLLFNATLINTRFKKIVGTHITFTTDQILELVKTVDYACKFIGFMQLGKNMAFPEETKYIQGDINFKLLQTAINRDGEIIGKVKIVIDDYETKKYFENVIADKGYPLEIVSCEQALVEIIEISKKLEEMPFQA